MKPAQVNTLYSKLTPHEQAALTFEAIARRDDADIAVIVDNVERHNYRAVNTVYNQRVIELVTLAYFYSSLYWKSRSLMLVDDTKALDSALIETCERLKVDITVVKKMAGVPIDEAWDLPEVSPDLVNRYVELFATCDWYKG